MRKPILVWLILSYLVGALPAAEFFVSPTGDDRSGGTQQSPFLTLERAQQAIRNATGKRVIWLRGGTYHLSKPLIFGPQDSGSEGAEVQVAPWPGEKVTLKGSVALKLDWRPFRDGVYAASVKGTMLESVVTTQLFCNNRRMVRARFPDWDFAHPRRGGKGYLTCEDGSLHHLTWREGDLDDRRARWRNPSTGIVHAFHNKNWGNMMYRIAGVDWDRRRINLGEGGLQCQRRSGPGRGRGAASPYYIENIFGELDAPHEWFQDIEKDLLYFKPPIGVRLEEALIEAAVTSRIIEFHGTQENPVHHVHLRGFRVTQSQTTFMADYEDLLRGDWAIHHGGAIYLTGAEDCRIEDCHIGQVGGNGVFHSGYNRRVEIAGCLIEDIGDSAVCYVGWDAAVRHPWTWSHGGRDAGEVTDKTPGPKSDDYPKDCTVRNSILRTVGVYGKQTSGVILSKAQNITISHCTIHDIPRAGVTFNDGTWGGHILEHCDIWDTVLETGEHGPFNGWGRDRFWTGLNKDLVHLDAVRTVHIRNNRITNQRPAISAGNWTIDLDDGCSNYEIYNNLSLGSTLKLRDGYFRKVYNNIHVSAVPLGWHCWPPKSEDVFERNITIVAGAPAGHTEPTSVMIKAAGSMCDHPWGKRHGTNLWWNVNTGAFAVSARGQQSVENWERWCQLGYGEHSVLGDPMFVDPAHGDYRVRLDSPALAIGFKNFPMDKFGHTMTRIVPYGGQFQGEILVRLRPDARGGKVHYTLDGSVPTAQSQVYDKPITLKATTTVRAQSFERGVPVGFAAEARFHRVKEPWIPSWYQSLMAGHFVAAPIDRAGVPGEPAQTQGSEPAIWRGMRVRDLAKDGDLIDASGGQDYGVYLDTVTEQAKQWGLQHADVVVAMDMQTITSVDSLREAERSSRDNRQVTVTVMRKYRKIQVRIPAGSRPVPKSATR